jgi:chaperonin GroES
MASQQKKGKASSRIRIQPLHDRVVLEPMTNDAARKTDAGIYIPETVNDDKGTKRGTVVAIGPGRYDDGELIPVSVKVGDEVLYQWGDTIKVDGTEYVIVRESEITAIIK